MNPNRAISVLRSIVPSFIVIATLSATPLLAANSDFEGVWRMDLERSDAMMRGLKVDNSYTLSSQDENLDVKRTFYGRRSGAIPWTGSS